MIQHITKTTRTFPSNLYNKLEERLKNNNSNKGNTAKITPIQEIETQIKCPKCARMVDRAKVVKKKYICYECGGYFRVKTNNRIRMVADPKTFEPWFEDMEVSNPLEYEGYEEKLAAAREKTGLKEAVTVGRCKVFGETRFFQPKTVEVPAADAEDEVPVEDATENQETKEPTNPEPAVTDDAAESESEA